MRVNPIFKKELITNVRISKIAVITVAFNICLSIIIVLCLYEGLSAKQYENIFDYKDTARLRAIAGGAVLCFTLIFVPVLAAKSIVSEREKHSIDLLLIAPFHPVNIVLGKLAAVMLVYLIILISAIPALSIIWSIGGNSFQELLKMLILLIGTAFYAAGIGLFFSCTMKRSITAVIWSYLVNLFLGIGTIMIDRQIGNHSWNYSEINSMGRPGGVLLLNPLAAFYYMLNSMNNGVVYHVHFLFFKISWVTKSMLVQVLTASVLTVLASYILKPFKIRRVHKKKERHN